MTTNRTIGILIVRLILGFIFLMQGFGKIFTWGVDRFMHMDFFYKPYKEILPDFLIFGTAYYTSYVEFIGGLCLIIGFKRDMALYALGSVLIIVTLGHGIAEPIWDLSHVMFRAVLLITLLFTPKEWDRYQLDYWLNKKQHIGFK